LATVKVCHNGLSMGVGNPDPVGGIRGDVVGWSVKSVRSHKLWLWQIDAPGLDGVGAAVTLTMRETPASYEAWRRLLQNLFERFRRAGFLRWHWVVEWQRRGTPHLHLAVYGPVSPGDLVVSQWLSVAASYGAHSHAQDWKAITGPVGWLQYLSKHASRGVAHYQRQGRPLNWDKTGRLWGHGGQWPVDPPVKAAVDDWPTYWRLRRQLRRWSVAQARSKALAMELRGDFQSAAAGWDRVGWLRRAGKCPERDLSSARGLGDWVPMDVSMRLLEWAGWDGQLKTLETAAALVASEAL
jgi:hypothetical protein